MDEHLHVRLKCCLQTILELEPQLESLDHSISMKADLHKLKKYLREVDNMHLAEADVHRLEQVTAHFLCEMQQPLQRAGHHSLTLPGIRVLQ